VFREQRNVSYRGEVSLPTERAPFTPTELVKSDAAAYDSLEPNTSSGVHYAAGGWVRWLAGKAAHCTGRALYRGEFGALYFAVLKLAAMMAMEPPAMAFQGDCAPGGKLHGRRPLFSFNNA